MTLIAAIIVFLVINFLTYIAYGQDKKRAIADEPRFPEWYLLRLAFIGGWFGAKIAQRRFRHKTRKQPFAARLNRIPLIWCMLAAMPFLIGTALDLVGSMPSAAVAQHPHPEEARSTPRFFQSARN